MRDPNNWKICKESHYSAEDTIQQNHMVEVSPRLNNLQSRKTETLVSRSVTRIVAEKCKTGRCHLKGAHIACAAACVSVQYYSYYDCGNLSCYRSFVALSWHLHFLVLSFRFADFSPSHEEILEGRYVSE